MTNKIMSNKNRNINRKTSIKSKQKGGQQVRTRFSPTNNFIETYIESINPFSNNANAGLSRRTGTGLTPKTSSPSPSQSPSPSPSFKQISPTTAKVLTITTLTSFFTFRNVLILFFILLILGINITYYLTRSAEIVEESGKGVIGYITGLIKWIIHQIQSLLNITTEGTKTGLDIAKGTTVGGLGLLEKVIDAPQHIVKEQQITPGSDDNGDGNGGNGNGDITGSFDARLEQTQKRTLEQKGYSEENKGFFTKTGYCYIGTDRGFRSCMYVGLNDKCKSGKIYNTMEICKHPSLRE
jgi:hypothetical protein